MIAILKLPMLYSLVIAVLWRVSGVPVPTPLHSAMHLLSDGLVPVALVTLGAQMASLESHHFNGRMVATLGLRLCLGPALGLLLICLMHIRPPLAGPLLVSTSFPVAVNTALLASEFDNEPEFAAAAVFYSTLFSAITVSVVIYEARLLFPS